MKYLTLILLEALLLSIDASGWGSALRETGTSGPSDGIEVAALCPERISDPRIDTLIPIILKTHKPGWSGSYTVTVKSVQGKGLLYKRQLITYGKAFEIEAGDTKLLYHPQSLGDHILEFTVRAIGSSTTVQARIEVLPEQ